MTNTSGYFCPFFSGKAQYAGISPSATEIFTSPAVKPTESVFIWVCARVDCAAKPKAPAAKIDVTKNSRLSQTGGSGMLFTMSSRIFLLLIDLCFDFYFSFV